MVYKDTVYLYTGHDEDKSTVFVMKDWRCFTSTDMVNRTDRGSPLSVKTFSWAKQDAWAMGKATFQGPSQLNPLNPFVIQQAETAGTSGQVQFEAVGDVGNMVAKGKADKQCLMVRGADFSKQVPAKFEARVKGKGKIDVYVNNLKGTALVSLICDGKEWTTLSKKIERKIDKGVGNIYFVFNGEGLLFDEWKFIY